MSPADTADLRRRADELAANVQLPRIPARTCRVELVPFADICPSLNAAIAACGRSGGGKVVVPSGVYRCDGPIRLASRVELHLEPGTFIKFSPDPRHYLPVVPTRWEGVDLLNYSPMIYGDGLADVAVTGRGVFCGGSEEWAAWRALQKPDQERARRLRTDGVPLAERVFGEGHFLRPSFVQFRGFTRVLVEDASFVDAAFWMLHPLYSSHVTVRRVHFDSLRVNNDGIDVDSCEDVLIEDAHFRNGDDAVVVKSGRDRDGLVVNRPTRRLVVRRCAFREVLHGFAVGSELSGGAADVYVHDIAMGKVRGEAVSFKSAPGRGGVIRRVHVFDVNVDETAGHLLSIVSEYAGQHYGEETTVYRDLQIANVRCRYAKCAFVLEGSELHPLENVRLDDVAVENADETYSGTAFTGSLRFRDVRVNGREIEVP